MFSGQLNPSSGINCGFYADFMQPYVLVFLEPCVGVSTSLLKRGHTEHSVRYARYVRYAREK
jgi:hypothetical protein